MSIISEQVRELRYKADIYNTVGSAWELNHAEAKILQRLLRKAADTIEALSKKLATNGGWIPCSERLPEESGFYMVTKKIKETGNRFTGKSRFDTQKGWNDPLNFVDIVAWQPLPEAYHG